MNNRKAKAINCRGWRRSRGMSAMLTGFLGLVLAPLTPVMAFDSGSTGADGALDFSGLPAGTVVDFDPASYNPPLDPDGDSVYHFTTITIPQGVTVRLRSDKAGAAPIHWLASGAVSIGGVLDLSGEAGHPKDPVATRTMAAPGPGGFPGGIGSRIPDTASTAGSGPGGGPTCTSSPYRNGAARRLRDDWRRTMIPPIVWCDHLRISLHIAAAGGVRRRRWRVLWTSKWQWGRCGRRRDSDRQQHLDHGRRNDKRRWWRYNRGDEWKYYQ